MNKLVIAIVTIYTLTSILSSCISLPNGQLAGSDMGDRFLEGRDNCSPPCWMDIRPGETSESDAIHVLRALEQDGKGQLIMLSSGFINWRAESVNYLLYPQNDIVVKIQVDLRPRSTILRSATLQKIIDLFGEPSNVILEKIRDGYFFVTVFYPSKGLAFIASSDGQGFLLQPGMKVSMAYFLAPSGLDDMMNSLYGKNSIADALVSVQVWRGFESLAP